MFPEIVDTMCRQSGNLLSWSHYRALLQIEDQTQRKDVVKQEMQELTSQYQSDKLEIIKNPVIAEFLGFSSNTDNCTDQS